MGNKHRDSMALMLTIRQAQMDEFQAAQDRRLITTSLPYLRALTQTTPGLDDTELCRLTQLSFRRARRWGVATTPALLEFASLALRHGLLFDTHPRVSAHLARAESGLDVAVLTVAGLLNDEKWRATEPVNTVRGED
jgi:hypothetical protein